MTIEQMVNRCYANAEQLGWTTKEISFPEMVALIHSEASEALESYREGEHISWTADSGKPMGIASEFADILIRIGHYSKALGINLDWEVDRKLEYNLTRGYRHGGKLA